MSNLIDITQYYDTQKVYCMGIGVKRSDLSAEELQKLEDSDKYVAHRDSERIKHEFHKAYYDLQRLSNIKFMPRKARKILSKWL